MVCILCYGFFNLFCNVWVGVCVFCKVWYVYVLVLLCVGCFGNMYTCIYCVLHCWYCVFVLFHLGILFVLSELVQGLLSPSENSTALGSSNNMQLFQNMGILSGMTLYYQTTEWLYQQCIPGLF